MALHPESWIFQQKGGEVMICFCLSLDMIFVGIVAFVDLADYLDRKYKRRPNGKGKRRFKK